MLLLSNHYRFLLMRISLIDLSRNLFLSYTTFTEYDGSFHWCGNDRHLFQTVFHTYHTGYQPIVKRQHNVFRSGIFVYGFYKMLVNDRCITSANLHCIDFCSFDALHTNRIMPNLRKWLQMTLLSNVGSISN